MRGLKYIEISSFFTFHKVALLVSAWIEIEMVFKFFGLFFVALLVSAWIEIGRACDWCQKLASHSS